MGPLDLARLIGGDLGYAAGPWTRAGVLGGTGRLSHPDGAFELWPASASIGLCGSGAGFDQRGWFRSAEKKIRGSLMAFGCFVVGRAGHRRMGLVPAPDGFCA